MSTKTSFKRLALSLVVALGFGVLGVAPASNAAVLGETLVIDAATDTAFVTDSATAVLTHSWGTTQAAALDDSNTIKATCAGPTGATCPTLQYWMTPTSDTANVQVIGEYPTYISGLFTETAATIGGSVRATVNVRAVNFPAVGTYTYTFYTEYDAAKTLSAVTTTWTVTVSTRDVTVTGVNKYVSEDIYPSNTNRTLFRASTDSAIVAPAGTVATPLAVGYALFTVKNAAGDTRTATSTAKANTSSATPIADTLTVTVSGPGLVTGISSVKAKSATVNAYNDATLRTATTHSASVESITVWSDGTAGTSTISVSSGGVVMSTITVVFTGTPASAAIAFSDTYVSLTAGTTVVGTVKDSGLNVMKSGTVYIYSTDTKIAGTNLSTNVYPTVATAYTIPSTGVLAFSLATADTGVATITLRDSWTVAASTWSSNEIVVTVTEAKIATLTVSFDKATYSPGERAVITYTAKDSAGRGLATAAISSALTPLSNAVLTDVTTASICGTNCGASNYGYLGTSFNGYLDTGVETRVVTMPTYGVKVTLTNTFATFGSTSAKTTVTAEATVVDPNATAIAGSTAAAEAATDAAAEAIDAANAATDAANLAAEAADAATVAAEEARDAADAATAAVEELATQVATLMAALKAQITTLANTVAKIAKKVKA
jgi:hypothetical protein